MRRIWLMTDTHFFHKNIVSFCHRPEDHNERMIRAWDRMVTPEDVVIHLGDVTLGEDFVTGLVIVKRPGKKWLVLGNHDKKSIPWYLDHGWDFVAHQVLLDQFGQRTLLSHTPQPDLGHFDVNIHGHFHNTEHRYWEQPYVGRLTDKHVLLAPEYLGYQPILLETVLKQRQEGKGPYGWKATKTHVGGPGTERRPDGRAPGDGIDA